MGNFKPPYNLAVILARQYNVLTEKNPVLKYIQHDAFTCGYLIIAPSLFSLSALP